MLDYCEQPVTADAMKELHRILKEGTADAAQDWFTIGDWKTLANSYNTTDPTTAPEDVDQAITRLLDTTPERMSFENIAKFHHDFEKIHPFQDGNGRVGRLVMFGQCLRNDIMPFVVLDEQKAFYYRGLQMFSEEPGFLIQTLRSFQDVYHQKFRDFVPPTPICQ